MAHICFRLNISKYKLIYLYERSLKVVVRYMNYDRKMIWKKCVDSALRDINNDMRMFFSISVQL